MDAQPPIRIIASIGRMGMVPAALVALISLFTSHAFQAYSNVDVVAFLGAGTLGALAIASLLRPRRALDAAMVFLAGMLAGFLFLVATEGFLGVLVIPLFAWLLLTVSGAAVGYGLTTGAVESDPRADAFLGEALTRMRSQTPVVVPATGGVPASPAPSSAPVPVPGAPVAGWYQEPEGTQLRWWDGADWTDDVRPPA
jgi:hypothetical protein